MPAFTAQPGTIDSRPSWLEPGLGAGGPRLAVTRAGAYVDVRGAAVAVTRAGAYVHIASATLEITRAGAYVEITRAQVNVTRAGAYVAITPTEPAQPNLYIPPSRDTLHSAQFRAFIGPRWLPASDPAFFDWSVLAYGDTAYDPTQFVPCVSQGLAAGATKLSFALSGNFWPGAGGFWIGPGAAGEAWEYCTYTGITSDGGGTYTLTGLGREIVNGEQTGVHSSGARLVFWWPIACDDGQLTLTETLDQDLCAVGWSAQLSGAAFPEPVLRNGHLCLVQTRSAGDALALANPGFEAGALSGWSETAADGSVSVTSLLAASGTYSVELTAGASAGTLIYQTVTVTPGMSYLWYFWTYAANGAPGFWGVSGCTAGLTAPATGGWQNVRVPFTVPAGVTSVELILQCPATPGATVYYDDAALQTASFGPWSVFLAGWLKNPSEKSDATQAQEWSTDIVGLDGMLADIEVLGVHAGPIDLARAASAESSPQLALACEMAPNMLPAGQAEYTAAQPDLSAASACDGDPTTLYISDRFVSTTANWPTINSGQMGFDLDQVHVAPYVGQAVGHRWIQLSQSAATSTDPSWAQGFKLIGPTNHFPGHEAGGGLQQGFIFGGMPYPNGKLILCENADLFNADYPTQDPTTTIIEISQYAISQGGAMLYGPLNFYFDGPTGPVQDTGASGQWGSTNPRGLAGQWWDDLSAAAGALCCSVFTGQVWNTTPQLVLWGSITAAELAANGAQGWQNDWSGANLPAPAPGQTMRRNWAGYPMTTAGGPMNEAVAWYVDFVSTPGYFIDGSRIVWLQLHLPPLGLTSRDAITAAAPGMGAELYIVSAGGAATCDGLPSAGALQIGAEQITYSAKTAANDGVVVTARGANGTAAAAHLAGDVVYNVVGGVALDLQPAAAIAIKRPVGLPLPSTIKLWGSSHDMPGTEDSNAGAYEYDYQGSAGQPGVALDVETAAAYQPDGAGLNDVFTFTLAEAQYLATLLLECTGMAQASPVTYRLALNTLQVLADATAYSPARNMAAGTTARLLADQLLINAGVPSGAVPTAGADMTPPLTDVDTSREQAWNVLTSLASMAGIRISVGRDSKVAIAADPWWAISGTPAPASTLTRLELSAFDPEWKSGRDTGQVELQWHTPDDATRSVVYYPETADPVGKLLRVGPFVCANLAAAQTLAAKKYWQARCLYGATAECAGAPITTRAGDAAQVQWPVSGATWPAQDPAYPEMPPAAGATMNLLNRVYLVQSAHHQLKDGAWLCAFNLLQIGTTDER